MALDPMARGMARKFRERLSQRFGPEVLEVRVFGSRARGESRPGSDLDVFVMIRREDPQLTRAIAATAWDVAYEGSEPALHISPLVMAREHFQELLERELRLAQDIASEGVPV